MHDLIGVRGGKVSPVQAIRKWGNRFVGLFTYPLSTSHYIELVNPLWSTHALRARVDGLWDETRDSRTITLRPSPSWRGHRAGQHVRIGLEVDGRHYTRTYTISSAPERSDGRFTLTVKIMEGGRISQHLVRNLKVGDYIQIGTAQGNFYLPDAGAIKPLFITAGSGVTPAASMIRSLVAQERHLDTVHIHYAPHEYDAIFGNELRALSDKADFYRYRPVYTRALGSAKRQQQHFSARQLAKLCPDWKTRVVYACGPQGLIDAVTRHWQDAGLGQQLHVERFRAPVAKIPRNAVGGKIQFAASGITVKADGHTSLLRVAEDAGLNPPHGCRMGICHTCNTTLVSGSVRDLRDGSLISEPDSIIQTCVCAAAGNATLKQ